MLGNTTSITITRVPALCPCGVRRHVAAFPLRDMSRSSPATFGSSLHVPCFFQHVRLSVDQRPSAVENVASALWADVAPWFPARLAMSDFVPFRLFSNGVTKRDKTGQKRTKADIPTFHSCGADILVCGFPTSRHVAEFPSNFRVSRVDQLAEQPAIGLFAELGRQIPYCRSTGHKPRSMYGFNAIWNAHCAVGCGTHAGDFRSHRKDRLPSQRN